MFLLNHLMLVLTFAVPFYATAPGRSVNDVMTSWRSEVGADGRANLPWDRWSNRDQYEQRKTSRYGCWRRLEANLTYNMHGPSGQGKLQELLELRSAYTDMLMEAEFDRLNAELGVNYVDRGVACYGKKGAWSDWYVSSLDGQINWLRGKIQTVSDKLDEYDSGASVPARHPRASDDIIADRAAKLDAGNRTTKTVVFGKGRWGTKRVGPLITEVSEGTQAARLGVEAGWTITTINGEKWEDNSIDRAKESGAEEITVVLQKAPRNHLMDGLKAIAGLFESDFRGL